MASLSTEGGEPEGEQKGMRGKGKGKQRDRDEGEVVRVALLQKWTYWKS